ncbi:MAG: NADP-dependent malic enzyme [Pseudomonadota bacterium]
MGKVEQAAGEAADKEPSEAEQLAQAALFFHRYPQPGKVQISSTKPLGNQRDLALAYSPGVAAPCLEIEKDPSLAADYTSRANLVGVISNGTAVLGLGAIGALASKPVMEGKAVLFKKFAGIDVFDIEINETDPDRFISAVASMEPTFGGINLEDIKAPECFVIENALKERMGIPVFHDDQHGTAIIVSAAVRNALELSGKRIEDVKLVTAGAGAAALACLGLLEEAGLPKQNIWITDLEGVVYQGREALMDDYKAAYAQKTDKRTLADVIEGADIFLGLSAGGVLKPDMVAKMAKRPLIMALANPNPEIRPEDARSVRDDAIICTGRSDYPNQVNNVLCFPYIFRGALDVGASTINTDMKLAAVEAIASLAREEPSDVAARAYGGQSNTFGPEFLIPYPFDNRLILRVAPAVAKAAMQSGVATRPIKDFGAYMDQLNRFVFRSGVIMKPVILQAQSDPKRVIYAEGEDERALRAAQIALEDGIATPILIGRPAVIETRIKKFGLKISPGRDLEIVNPEDDPRYRTYVDAYFSIVGRSGVTPDNARTIVRTNSTVIAALAVKLGDADAMICGLQGGFAGHLAEVQAILPCQSGMEQYSALSLLITDKGGYFLTDTHISYDPSPHELAQTAIRSARYIRRFGIEPKAALVSHSNFGSRPSPSANKMRQTLAILRANTVDFEVDGEMHADLALNEVLRDRVMPNSYLKGEANFLVFPNLDSANTALNMTKILGDALHVGPILIGPEQPAHILTPSVTSRGVVNMTAIASVDGQLADKRRS